MPQDKIKAAARKRMAETGEPYALARRMVTEERARIETAEPEVTPENAQGLLGEGKITVNQARAAHGLPPFDPPPPPLVIPEGAGDFLRTLLGPLEPGLSAEPPYTHVLRLPETEEEMAAEPVLPAYTVTPGEAPG